MTVPPNAAGDTEIGSPVREGRISSLFGMREDPFEGEPRFHAGIDIAAPVGTPVRPVAAGRVIFSGSYQGFGRIILKTAVAGLETAHLTKIALAFEFSVLALACQGCASEKFNILRAFGHLRHFTSP